MNTRTETKNLADYIMMVILIINVILGIIFRFTDSFEIISFVNTCIIFIILSIGAPINSYIKRNILSNKLVILSIILRGALLTIFIVTAYKTLLSANYHLKYTYWFGFISLILLISIFYIEMLVNDYKKRKLIGKKHNIIYISFNMALIVLINGFSTFYLINSINYPEKHILLQELKTPQYISIYKYGDNSLDLSSNIKIKEREVIKRIMEDMESTTIKNITSTELLNYQRMKKNNPPYYLMIFSYKDSKNEGKGLENGYIEQFVITSNKYVVIEEMNSRKGILLDKNYYNDIYQINLSKETIEMIVTYLN